jgi:hypothetical protein
MVFNATFNNISAILWQSLLLMEETGVYRENHRPVTRYWPPTCHTLLTTDLSHVIDHRPVTHYWPPTCHTLLTTDLSHVIDHRPVACYWPPTCHTLLTTNLSHVINKLYHIMLYWVHIAWAEFELTTLVAIGNDCTGSCESNCHTIMTTTTPMWISYCQWKNLKCSKIQSNLL